LKWNRVGGLLPATRESLMQESIVAFHATFFFPTFVIISLSEAKQLLNYKEGGKKLCVNL
jgi:hypothetical protein